MVVFIPLIIDPHMFMSRFCKLFNILFFILEFVVLILFLFFIEDICGKINLVETFKYA